MRECGFALLDVRAAKPRPLSDAVLQKVLEQFTFLHQQFEVAFRILETSEDLLLLLDFDLVEDEDQEDAGDA